VLQLWTWHALHVVLPGAQVSMPAPFGIAHARLPSGLAHAREMGSRVPQGRSPLGVHARVVSSAPQLLGAPSGVQASRSAGRGSVQRASGSVRPVSSVQRAVRVRAPESAVHAQAPLRDSVPLAEVTLQVALRFSVPLPLQTALALHGPHAV
jgi:hypothetical protein